MVYRTENKNTISTIIQQLCDEIGIMSPADLCDENDDLARQFLALANQTGQDLSQRHAFLVLIKKCEGEDNEKQTDFLRYVDRGAESYLSADYIVDIDDSLKRNFDDKDDMTLLPDHLLKAGLKVKFLEAKGFDATQAKMDFEKSFCDYCGQENRQRQKKNLDLGFEGSYPSGGSLHPMGL